MVDARKDISAHGRFLAGASGIGAPLAIVIFSGASASIAGCDSNGSDSEVAEPPLISLGIAAGDLNGDGLDDIALSTTVLSGPPPHEGYISVLISEASGTGSFVRSDRLALEWDPGKLRIADLNGDSVPDLVVHKENLDNSGGGFAVFFQSSAANGQFPSMSETAHTLISDVEAVDMNADGLLDLVTVGPVTTIFRNVLGNPGSFRVARSIDVGASVVRAADLNNDGSADLVLGVGASGTLRIFMQQSGDFAPETDISVGAQLHPLAVHDVDLDGRLDILTGSFRQVADRSARFSLVLQAPAPAAPGQFLPPVNYVTDSTIRAVAAADLNGDTRPDVVTAHNLSTVINNDVTLESSVSVLLQDSSGSFEAPVAYAADGQASDIALGDFNGDGLIDIATDSDGVVVLINDASAPGSFLPPRNIGR